MDFLYDAPYILRILSALAAILIFNRIIKSLILSVAGGTLLLALWCGHDIWGIINVSTHKISSSGSIMLTIVLFLVIWLSSIMEKTGVMNDMVAIIKKSISRRAGFAVLPAIIGMLPMPGGALFSAPMVNDMDKGLNVAPMLKSEINYWFRHIWEYWWPLYPGVLLALELTGLSPGRFIILQSGLSFFAIAGGYFVFLKKIPESEEKERSWSIKNIIQMPLMIAPVLTIIAVYTAISVFRPGAAETSGYLPMTAGIIIAIFTVIIQRRPGLKVLAEVITSANTLKLVLLVAVIGIYSAFIETPLPDGTFIMEHVRGELSGNNIPVLFIIMLIPMISGLSTGIAVGFVGASFPIVMNLLGPDPAITNVMSYTVIAYSFGFAGMMLSPVHVCHVVTVKYFNSSLNRSSLSMIAPSLFIMAGGLLISLIVTSFF
jgi:integral membrane protein (TIGR00529 family)